MPLSSLNSEQLGAAKAPFGKNLVIASAGTGKTSTIVGRISHLLSTGFNPKDILLLTFTNKAASEMVNRLANFFDKELILQIEAGTFHAVSYRLLKKNGIVAHLKEPRELKTLFRSIHEKRSFGHLGDTKPYSATYLFDSYSLFLNTQTISFGKWISEKNSEQEPYKEIYEDIIAEYEETKADYGYAGYDDLLIKFLKFASESNEPLFREVLVDEYQDTNKLQQRLINAINPPSLFCVGDYDQSIYAFNGADISIIASFHEREENASVFSLSKNYRSTSSILELANTVIANNERIYPKKLEVIRNGVDEPPRLLVYDTTLAQYESIAHKIKSSIHSHNEIAVIFRNNSSADGIEATLREVGIPAKRRGGISFFDSKEIKALLNTCSVFSNPKDMMGFIDIMSYGKGVGNAIAKEIFEALVEVGGDVKEGLFNPRDVKNPFKNRVRNVQLGLFDDFFELGSTARFYDQGFDEAFLSNPLLKHPKLSLDSGKFLNKFYTLLKDLKHYKNPRSIIKKISESEFFDEITEKLSRDRGKLKDGNIDENLKLEAKNRIFRKVSLLLNLSEHYNDMERFLNAMVLGSKEMSEGEGVNLLTVHASKGLEFKEVYVIDLMEGRFPNLKLVQKGGSIEEERRLFYVAATRAKDKLFLSYAKYDPIRKTDFVPSTFIFEAGLLKKA